MSMFEKATRLKIRFEAKIGMLSVEDLWDLPLTGNKTNLDDIARDLYSKLKSTEDVSFVFKERKSDERIQLAFDIVKHIIEVKLTEREEAQKQQANADRRQQLLSLISQKENQALAEMPLDELKKMVEQM